MITISEDELRRVVEAAFGAGMVHLARGFDGKGVTAYTAEVVRKLVDIETKRGLANIAGGALPAEPNVCDACAAGNHHGCTDPCSCYIAGQVGPFPTA